MLSGKVTLASQVLSNASFSKGGEKEAHSTQTQDPRAWLTIPRVTSSPQQDYERFPERAK